jgi:transcriptional regulator with XRE-family HTH domain
MEHMGDYAVRLAHALALAGKDANDLARELGVSYQAVMKALKGTTKALAADNNSKAARFLGVDPDWLATGEGSPRSIRWPFTRELLAACASADPIMVRRAENAARATLGLDGIATAPAAPS